MPNSFSRFLSDAELSQVRELYLRSLDEAEQDAQPAGSAEGDTGVPSGQETEKS